MSWLELVLEQGRVPALEPVLAREQEPVPVGHTPSLKAM